MRPRIKAEGVDPEYFYPWAGDPPAPRGQKLILLTTGGVATIGIWTDDSNIIGYQFLYRRNKVKEAKLAKG